VGKKWTLDIVELDNNRKREEEKWEAEHKELFCGIRGKKNGLVKALILSFTFNPSLTGELGFDDGKYLRWRNGFG
jgi:hypothetical protein